jgi:hypothetical protein
VAAIAASLLLTRARDESDITNPPQDNPAVRMKLDAIRAAGL